MNIVEDIANYLASKNVGVVGQDIIIGSLPDTLDNGIMLTGIGGNTPELNYRLFYQNIEIWTRNKKTEDGFNKLKSVFDELHLLSNVQTTNAYIYFIHSLSDLESAGRDLNGRALHKIIIKALS